MTDSQAHDTRFLQSTSKHIGPHFCKFNSPAGLKKPSVCATSKDKYQRVDSQPKEHMPYNIITAKTNTRLFYVSRAINGL